MKFAEKSLSDFLDEMGSKAPVPGGGGGAAAVGAVAASLAQMVCSLTSGKEKYANVEDEICQLAAKTKQTRLKMLELIDKDAKAFEPLSKAYSIPKDNPERESIMEAALVSAASAPIELMEVLCETIDATARIAEIGTPLAISDAGVAAICCKSALQSAALNVFINTKSMKDRLYAKSLEDKTNEMLDEYCTKADKIYTDVLLRIQ